MIPVTRHPRPQSPASRGGYGHLRAEGERLVNRSHPAPGPTPAVVSGIAGAHVAATATLAPHQADAESAYLHRDVFRLPAQGASVKEARHRIGERLRQWGVDGDVDDDAALVISELFTNALVHTDSSEITCRVQTTAHTVYLAITDQGMGPTGPQVREPDAESGRGLILVNALAEVWGVTNEHGTGRTVWAILPWGRAAGVADSGSAA